MSSANLCPGALNDDTGARVPHEPGHGGPAAMELTDVDADEIGGGIGLDEAELARSAPLDGEPWSDDVVDEDDRSPQ